MTFRFFFIAILLLFSVSLFGCGGGGSGAPGGSAPSGSTIIINPDSVDVAAGGAPDWHTHFFTISVIDPDGNPRADTVLDIFFPWAVPDPAGVVQLYDGATPKNSPMRVKTDKFGIYQLRFDYLAGGLEWDGILEVRSGAVFVTADFSVSIP